VQVEHLDVLPLGLSIAVGFLATAILVVNNVRDL
jgi:1,4-dihydroxy-2-naphthoate octaprenyltransferase